VSGEIGRVGDNVLHVGDILRKVNGTEKLDVDIVELESVDGCEGVTIKNVSLESYTGGMNTD
jgi:hypothetical protein